MSSYTGKFEYRKGAQVTLQGPCQLTFDAATVTLTPPNSGPMSFDWGDVDTIALAEWSLTLQLFTGKTIELKQFASAFSRMSSEVIAAWRDRTSQCMLLEDLEPVAQFEAAAAVDGATAERGQLRLFKSNLAFIPTAAGTPFNWRLADIDSIQFDGPAYAFNLKSRDRSLLISKLAKKTDEFNRSLGDAWNALRTQSAVAIHAKFPFLQPDEVAQVSTAMPEGRSALVSTLRDNNPQLPPAIRKQTIGPSLKPYFDHLWSIADRDHVACGFKFIRPDEVADDEPAAPDEQFASAGEPEQPLLFWFFLPIAGTDLIAWEATTGSGRATYIFRVEKGIPAKTAIDLLTTGLALVNFRREPVYLSDESLKATPKFHRYAIGARKLPELRFLRSCFIGRAIHSSPEAWRQSLDALCSKPDRA